MIFDGQHVIDYAGSLPVMRPAEWCGLADLVSGSVTIGHRKRVNAPVMVGGIVTLPPGFGAKFQYERFSSSCGGAYFGLVGRGLPWKACLPCG